MVPRGKRLAILRWALEVDKGTANSGILTQYKQKVPKFLVVCSTYLINLGRYSGHGSHTA